MRTWQAQKSQYRRFDPGQEVVSFIFQGDKGSLCREDIPADQAFSAEASRGPVMGWWRWRASARPPTQRELNARLEQLWASLQESPAVHKEALQWLVGLYLTRKKILRQEPGGFIHVKSGQKTSVNQESLSPQQIQSAMEELMAVIS